MSTALYTSIVSRLNGTETLTGAALTAQSSLVGRLGRLAISGSPVAVMLGNFSNIGAVFPAITFHPIGGIPDGRWGDNVVMMNTHLAFEVWDQSRSMLNITEIDGLVQKLLDMKLGITPNLPVSDHDNRQWMYWSELQTESFMHFDDTTRCWCSLSIYRFVRAKFQ